MSFYSNFYFKLIITAMFSVSLFFYVFLIDFTHWIKEYEKSFSFNFSFRRRCWDKCWIVVKLSLLEPNWLQHFDLFVCLRNNVFDSYSIWVDKNPMNHRPLRSFEREDRRQIVVDIERNNNLNETIARRNSMNRTSFYRKF